MVGPRDILSIPQVYQAYQWAGGFFGARLIALKKYARISDRARIVDIGCGPGFLREHLPRSCQYFGFDTDALYIARAQKKQQANSDYRCMAFDEKAARDLAPVDIIMMNGLLHHLSDAQARDLLSVSIAALGPTGQIFTLDGCYIPHQKYFRKKLLDWDRGIYVRSQRNYEALFPINGVALQSHVDEDLSWVKYTFLTIVATKKSAAA